jgi:hypothetical protein
MGSSERQRDSSRTPLNPGEKQSRPLSERPAEAERHEREPQPRSHETHHRAAPPRDATAFTHVRTTHARARAREERLRGHTTVHGEHRRTVSDLVDGVAECSALAAASHYGRRNTSHVVHVSNMAVAAVHCQGRACRVCWAAMMAHDTMSSFRRSSTVATRSCSGRSSMS